MPLKAFSGIRSRKGAYHEKDILLDSAVGDADYRLLCPDRSC